jgi:hypothetical protein
MKMFAITLMSLAFTFVCCAQSKTEFREVVCILGSRLSNRGEEIADLNELVSCLEAKNYKVHKFFNESNDWEAIKKASLNACIFIYRGHGTHLGIDEGFGGIVIGESISAQKIASELKFNNNPIVLFPSVCGGAGSSAGDETDIGIDEAQKRVIGSSLPFFLCGAKAYYANNYVGGMYKFLNKFLENIPIDQLFESSASTWNTVEINKSVTDNRLNSNFKIGIASSKGGGSSVTTTTINGVTTSKTRISCKGYSIAYVGDPNFRINGNVGISKIK